MGFRISFKNNESLFFRVAKPNERKAWVEALERVRRRGVFSWLRIVGSLVQVYLCIVCVVHVCGEEGEGRGIACTYIRVTFWGGGVYWLSS